MAQKKEKVFSKEKWLGLLEPVMYSKEEPAPFHPISEIGIAEYFWNISCNPETQEKSISNLKEVIKNLMIKFEKEKINDVNFASYLLDLIFKFTPDEIDFLKKMEVIISTYTESRRKMILLKRIHYFLKEK